MVNKQMMVQKLRKEEEICRLQIEVLEMEEQMTGKLNTRKFNQTKKLRGEKCYERVVLEQQLAKEQELHFEDNIA